MSKITTIGFSDNDRKLCNFETLSRHDSDFKNPVFFCELKLKD
ncbi:hypothetical protein M153_3000003644 [Pseudoloma neurophilia]|uniref:Uncharacterized protein n=1 Tax=Pseudoloma neurophilia TaxID=146866 RepID=A0A0R0M7H2_9MICR|nr:hypothetical protein M153_3000003644 [Pseudoloma neurophilia]